MSIADNWNAIRSSIAALARRPVDVVAVTKLRSADEIRAVASAGATLLGENRVEEAQRKFGAGELRAALPGAQVHFIGHLQSNKAKAAAALFDCVQSLDSEPLARELERRCAALGRTLEVLIEVSVSGEQQKYGVQPQAVAPLALTVLALPHLRLRGLMTMAPLTCDERVLRSTFGGLRLLAERLAGECGAGHVQTLSMGMSNDYRIAVEEGSTMVRIGTALFA